MDILSAAQRPHLSAHPSHSARRRIISSARGTLGCRTCSRVWSCSSGSRRATFATDLISVKDDTMTTTSSKNQRLGSDPAAKRSRPCDACRRRKSKCVTEDGQTICVLCAFHNQECLYLEAPQPRKRALPSGTADAQSPSKRSRTILIKPGTGVEEYDTLPGPSLLKRTLGLQNRHHSEYVGPNAIPDVYSGITTDVRDSNAPDPNKPSPDYVRFVHPLAAFRITPDVSTSGWDQERSDIEEIESTAQGHGAELVELYFRIVHPSFPVLHKDV